jgi:hypothetical protein
MTKAKGFVRPGKGRQKGYRRIAVSMPEELFERISERARAAHVPFTVTAVDLLRCGLLDIEDSEAHDPENYHPMVSSLP